MNHVDKPFSLSGKKIVITRSQDQQSEARYAFEAVGALVYDLPALVIGPPDKWTLLDNALLELDSFHWIIFSSSNGVQAVESRLNLKDRSLVDLPTNLKIAAVGRKTARSLKDIDVSVDFIPPQFVAESLIENFPVSGLGLKVLLPRVQSGGRKFLSESFIKAGAKVVQVPAYESRCPDNIPQETIHALKQKEVNIIAFTSGKTVANTASLLEKYFGKNWQKILVDIQIISIGPQTSISCIDYFKRVDAEAEPHDLDGLVNACIQLL
ncbi:MULTISPECIES: uroporphyrinogen-III synthase [Prochlorococcus]|uniref:uroporphyrinogen-III synthase n=1 Tax=Prochlorococcus TaxID=1218 RepID=UPI000533AED3|nr:MULTISPECIES: uroporphyrinogen-III synthase [Prochlorococcus]KGG13261.1 Uroporphyrinogen-III synthase [Prochlorococcus sp. MIT 0601]